MDEQSSTMSLQSPRGASTQRAEAAAVSIPLAAASTQAGEGGMRRVDSLAAQAAGEITDNRASGAGGNTSSSLREPNSVPSTDRAGGYAVASIRALWSPFRSWFVGHDSSAAATAAASLPSTTMTAVPSPSPSAPSALAVDTASPAMAGPHHIAHSSQRVLAEAAQQSVGRSDDASRPIRQSVARQTASLSGRWDERLRVLADVAAAASPVQIVEAAPRLAERPWTGLEVKSPKVLQAEEQERRRAKAQGISSPMEYATEAAAWRERMGARAQGLDEMVAVEASIREQRRQYAAANPIDAELNGAAKKTAGRRKPAAKTTKKPAATKAATNNARSKKPVQETATTVEDEVAPLRRTTRSTAGSHLRKIGSLVPGTRAREPAESATTRQAPVSSAPAPSDRVTRAAAAAARAPAAADGDVAGGETRVVAPAAPKSRKRKASAQAQFDSEVVIGQGAATPGSSKDEDEEPVAKRTRRARSASRFLSDSTPVEMAPAPISRSAVALGKRKQSIKAPAMAQIAEVAEESSEQPPRRQRLKLNGPKPLHSAAASSGQTSAAIVAAGLPAAKDTKRKRSAHEDGEDSAGPSGTQPVAKKVRTSARLAAAAPPVPAAPAASSTTATTTTTTTTSTTTAAASASAPPVLFSVVLGDNTVYTDAATPAARSMPYYIDATKRQGWVKSAVTAVGNGVLIVNCSNAIAGMTRAGRWAPSFLGHNSNGGLLVKCTYCQAKNHTGSSCTAHADRS